MLCVPYAYGVVWFLKKHFGNIKYRKIFIIGKASLHIYLTQMVFFGFGGGAALDAFFRSLPSVLSGMLESVLAVLICVPVGILFFSIETRVREKLFKKKA